MKRAAPRLRSGALLTTGRSDHQRAVLAFALGEAARFHPVIGPAEQGRIIIIDMLVVDESAQQLVWLERAFGRRTDMMRIFVEIGVDAIDGHVLGVVIGLA